MVNSNSELKEQFEIRRSQEYRNVYEVYLRGEKVFEWDDDQTINCPEDLIWLREISDIFFKGVEVGLSLVLLLFKENQNKIL